MTRNIALVTGAAQGIGYACAEALAEDGFQLVLADINAAGVEEAARKLGNGAVGIACDLGNIEQIDAMFAKIEAELGFVHTLVNNAGVALPGNFLDYSLDDFRKVIDVNLTGLFYASQRASKAMVAQEINGSIVNMSSINAVVAIPAIPAYCASKGGVMQLTKSMSLALAPHGLPRERGWSRLDRHGNDGWRECQSRSHEDGHVAHAFATHGHGT